MLYVLSNSFDPYFNLATEEFLLKNRTENIIMLWRSEPTVVIGKHQNANAELNHTYISENNINVARRLSGGGTVVHDLQNLNFTYLANGEEGKLIDFKKFLTPIIKYLSSLGIDAHIGKTNDLRIGELKISGNAEHVYRKRVLHHGTLLFNSDLKQLGKAISASPGKYIDKAVQSNRATVTNISNFLEKKVSVEEFTIQLFDFFQSENGGTFYELTDSDIEEIQKLVSTKYKTKEWIWGYSPKYSFVNEFDFEGDPFKVELYVEKGVIKDSKLNKLNENTESKDLLNGAYHNWKEMAIKLKIASFLKDESSVDSFCTHLL